MTDEPAIRVRRRSELSPSERLKLVVCPFCRDRIDEVASCYECAACGTWFHDQCFLENKGCMTLGCREARSKNPPPRPLVTPVAAPPGLNVNEVVTAAATSSAFATLVMLLVLATDPRPRQLAVLAGGASGALLLVSLLRSASRRPPRAKVSSTFVFLCGLFAGFLGAPIAFLLLTGGRL